MTTRPMMGTTWNRLTVIEEAGKNKWGYDMWICQCKCGTLRHKALGQALRGGHTQSCGCLQKEAIYKHGHARQGKTSREYRAWHMMLQRCTNKNAPNYPDYGGRGVVVCQRWRHFQNFLADMGERPPGTSLDRKNNDGNYEPGNCRWATPIEQHNNMRNNVWITIAGITKSAAQWSRDLGCDWHTVQRRARRWAEVEARGGPA